MKHLLPLVFLLTFIIGCDRIEGQLNVAKEFKLINSKGSTHIVKLGTYSADIKANTSKKITLRLNNDSDEKFVFVHGGNIPENGSFQVLSKASGQPVDLSGNIVTDVKKSEIKEGSQTCTYQSNVQVCYPIPTGGVNCTIESRPTFGYQQIRYYDQDITKNVTLSVKIPSAVEEAAEFIGSASYAERVILYQSTCR